MKWSLALFLEVGSAPKLIKSVCVFCGSGLGIEPAYEAAANELGTLLARSGVALVYGGGSHGLMGTIAEAALRADGYVVGVIPEFLVVREQAITTASELIVTDSMHERKLCMFERSDAFIMLPGGLGTLEETVEQLTWAQIGLHDKPVIIANILGFWTPFLQLIDQMKRMNFIRPDIWADPVIVSSIAEILPVIESAGESATF